LLKKQHTIAKVTDDPSVTVIDVEQMLPEIGSYYQVAELLKTHARIKESSIMDLRRAL
jgi:hypothetical protein